MHMAFEILCVNNVMLLACHKFILVCLHCTLNNLQGKYHMPVIMLIYTQYFNDCVYRSSLSPLMYIYSC